MSGADSPADWGILRMLDAPVWLAKRHLGPLLALSVPARLIPAIPSALSQYLTWSQYGAPSATSSLVAALITYASLFLSMTVSVLTYGAMVYAISRRLRGESPSALDCWRQAFRLPVLLTVLVVGILTVVGSAFCLVPGLLAAAWFGLAVPVAIEEGVYGGKALDRAQTLARHGRYGPWLSSTAAMMMCMVITWFGINYALSSVATVPAMVAGAVSTFRAAAAGGATGGNPWAGMPVWIVPVITLTAGLTGALSDTYLSVALVLLYRRAIDLLEGHDLRAAIGSSS